MIFKMTNLLGKDEKEAGDSSTNHPSSIVGRSHLASFSISAVGLAYLLKIWQIQYQMWYHLRPQTSLLRFEIFEEICLFQDLPGTHQCLEAVLRNHPFHFHVPSGCKIKEGLKIDAQCLEHA